MLRAVAPEGCRVANGIAFSRDGSEMFFVDSPTRSIQRLEYSDENLEAISLRNPDRFSSDPGEPHLDFATFKLVHYREGLCTLHPVHFVVVGGGAVVFDSYAAACCSTDIGIKACDSPGQPRRWHSG